MVSRYEETEAKREVAADQISQRAVRRRKLERFIETGTGLPELYMDHPITTAFDDMCRLMAPNRV